MRKEPAQAREGRVRERNDEAGSEKTESGCNLPPVGLDRQIPMSTHPGQLGLGGAGHRAGGKVAGNKRETVRIAIDN